MGRYVRVNMHQVRLFLATFVILTTLICLDKLKKNERLPISINEQVSVKSSKFVDPIPLNRRLSHQEVGYVFTDPDTYEGPILKAWPPNQDRNVSRIIKPGQNTTLTGKENAFCRRNYASMAKNCLASIFIPEPLRSMYFPCN